MAVTIILGATFKTPMYPHRVVIKKISSKTLDKRHGSPTEIYIFNTTGFFNTLLFSNMVYYYFLFPIRVHQVADHPQAKIINPQLSIFKTRSDIKITKTRRFIFSIKTT